MLIHARHGYALICLLIALPEIRSADLSGITLTPIIDGLTGPVFVTHAGDGRNDLYIVEQGGLIRVAQDNHQGGFDLLPQPFHTFTVIEAGGEKGLLGLAFHPNYAINGRLFVNITRRASGQLQTQILELRRSASDIYRSDGSERLILSFDQPQDNHNGGMIAFGPADGMLYIGTGDGGSGGDTGPGHAPEGNGQSLQTLLGKILRIDVDPVSGTYGIPTDNPFVADTEARPEIWAYGLRNPWRFSFDRGTGHRLFCGDVGQGELEEVDIIERGGNYGWPILEGTRCNRPAQGCDNPDLIAPIAEYPNTGFNAVTGGYLYRGSRIPAMEGLYIFGDYGNGEVYYLESDGLGGWREEQLILGTPYFISSFGEDLAGEIYLCDLVGGQILRLISTDPAHTAARPWPLYH